jgi:signal transduction histidine kinase
VTERSESQLATYLEIIEDMKSGQFCDQAMLTEESDPLGQALCELSQVLRVRQEEMQTLQQVTKGINAGLRPSETLNHIYESFHGVVPYDRIGFAVIEPGGATAKLTWVRTVSPDPPLDVGYRAELKGSSLLSLLETNPLRVLDDLEEYYQLHPDSESTRRMIGEGMRSSLTCLLSSAEAPIGFLFFSSCQPHAYDSAHVDFFLQIAGELSLTIQRGRLFQSLKEAHESLGLAVHDLRNPLAVLRTFIGVARRKPEAVEPLLPSLEETALSMTELVDDILEFSQMGSGNLSLDVRKTDVNALLERALHVNQKLAVPKSIQLELQLEEGVGEATFDRHRLTQVLNNFLSNAIKFSDPGTMVTLGARKNLEGLEIYVKDQGPGIPVEEKKRLFKPFSRTSARPTAGEPSTGLGLVICKWIIEAHGGVAKVESAPGSGSTFSFILPDSKLEN